MPRVKPNETRHAGETTLIWAASRAEIIPLIGAALGYTGNPVDPDGTIRNHVGNVIPCLSLAVSPTTRRAKLIWVPTPHISPPTSQDGREGATNADQEIALEGIVEGIVEVEDDGIVYPD